MRLRNYNLMLVTSILLLSLFYAPSALDNGSDEELNIEALTSGEIDGIKYSYGDITFEDSGNVTYVNNGSVTETFTTSTTGVRDIALIKDVAFKDVYYRISVFNDSETDSSSTEFYTNTTGWADIVEFLNSTLPAKFGKTYLEWVSNSTLVKYIEDFDTVTTPVVDQNDQFLGQYPQNVSYFNFLDKDVSDQIINRTMIIEPVVILVDITTEIHQVFYNRTEFAFALMAYYQRYSVEYNISASIYQVNITDGENFGLNVNMFDRIDAEYLEVVSSFFGYYFFGGTFTDLEFTNDGSTGNTTKVWENGYGIPFSLHPVTYSEEGSTVQVGFRHISSSLVSTYQSLVAGFVTQSANASEELDELTLQSRAAVWGLSTSTTMVAYEDGNENDRLDVGVNRDGLFVDSSKDRVAALGLAEAYETNVTNGYYISSNYNKTLNFTALGIEYNEMNVNNTFRDFSFESYGFGDIDASSTNQFTWNEPTNDDEGNVVFDFGMSYNNFPVTWVSMRDGSTTTDLEDISYNYKVVVDPNNGKATVSPTWTYGGITDADLKARTGDLSLALLLKSEFFAASATYTAQLDDTPVNSTRTSTFAVLGVRIGDYAATQIDASGPKQFYLSNGVNNTASFDALRLATVAGHFEGERVSPFTSESESTGGTASTGTLTERLVIDFVYSVDLLVVSYPVWGGNDIIHDPDYSIDYQDVKPEVTSETTTDSSTDSSSTTSDTSSSTSRAQTSSDSTTSSEDQTSSITSDPVEESSASPLPGLGLLGTIFTLSIGILVVKRSKPKQ